MMSRSAMIGWAAALVACGASPISSEATKDRPAAQPVAEPAAQPAAQPVVASGPTPARIGSIRLLGAAIKSLDGGELDETERLTREAIAADPTHAEARHVLGVVLRRRGGLDAAEVELQAAVDLAGPDLADAGAKYRRTLGALLAERGRDPAGDATTRARRRVRARELLEQASALNPNDAGAHYELGRLLVDLGDTAGARAAFSRALERKPGHEQARRALAALPPA